MYIICCSANNGMSELENAELIGADELLPKPILKNQIEFLYRKLTCKNWLL